jgi:hypothetical protein
MQVFHVPFVFAATEMFTELAIASLIFVNFKFNLIAVHTEKIGFFPTADIFHPTVALGTLHRFGPSDLVYFYHLRHPTFPRFLAKHKSISFQKCSDFLAGGSGKEGFNLY